MSMTICTQNVLRKLLHAYDWAVIADEEANLQEQQIEWKDMFSRYGLRVRLEKTEVMCVEPRWKEQEMHLDGKKLKQRNSFVYLGGAICEDGNSPVSKRKKLWDAAWTLVRVFR